MNASRLLLAAALVLAPFAAPPVSAQERSAGTAIYTCTNAAGRKLTSDRPIPECNDREQRVLNSDGSVRNVREPSYTSEERAARDEAERRRNQERVTKQEAIRRDRNLLARYPNDAAHAKAREAAKGVVQDAIKRSEQRVADLRKERKPLGDEAEFYVGKTLPIKLRQQIEAVDVSIEAQESIAANQKVEAERIDALYDAELAHLKKLWAGAEPGSIGAPPSATGKPLAAAAAPASAPATLKR
ncbi:MAG TPA: hypothetical protein VFR90_07025 [Methylibium sp.]|uniref:hypothetical protein n=1 Tax=Methylibium sp. TaxID=2067992 RepID=UPI002DBF8BF9|nr:hypothetical protein [Methylibium sp.]HEU4458859.1 hypothetical protein [Methylibium sp.]